MEEKGGEDRSQSCPNKTEKEIKRTSRKFKQEMPVRKQRKIKK